VFISMIADIKHGCVVFYFLLSECFNRGEPFITAGYALILFFVPLFSSFLFCDKSYL
jgi:hypothetical protein